MTNVSAERGHTADESAAHLFMSTSRFMELVADGVIPRAQRRGYNLDRVRRAYCAHLRKTLSEHDEVARSSLVGARTALAQQQIEAATRKNAINQADYVPKDVFRKRWLSTVDMLTTRALAICLIAPAIEMRERFEVGEALRDENHAALNDMCNPARGLP
jgi:hypothetical protein